jgi:hypothetical protein
MRAFSNSSPEGQHAVVLVVVELKFILSDPINIVFRNIVGFVHVRESHASGLEVIYLTFHTIPSLIAHDLDQDNRPFTPNGRAYPYLP